MFSYKNTNNVAGWIVFLISAFTFITTMEPTASFWDCGEFISVSYKLMTPHPPGAPLFLLIGRMFSLFASDVTQVAYWINMTSALSSAFTILFLFWSFTMIARKVLKVVDSTPSLGQTIAIIGSGLIGALAYTFSDSFWFSAVEAEVYAMSAFFTAFVFWAILKWETVADEEGSDRWLILIAYMVGLSIGVHLLNLVAIPAIAFVYYFKKHNPTIKGAIFTLGFSSLLLLIILVGIIPGLPSIAAGFEVFFVNTLGAPFNSGVIFFCLALIGALVYGIYYSNKMGKRVLNISLLAFAFILIGYCSYGIIIIRSNFNPPIDENNPEDVMKFVSYLKREQYGDRPLFKGALFTAGNPIAYEEGAPLYRKEKENYVVYSHKPIYTYSPEHTVLFPRMHSTRPGHIETYKDLIKSYNNGYYKTGRKPTKYEDLRYLFDRQLGDMYWRYFLWNFVGRKGDIQNSGVLWPSEASEKIPEVMQSMARNNYYALPLILGIIGIIFLFFQDQRTLLILGMLFFFTGIAIILYLNAPPYEPRERDYAYAGSYYAYCFFIGFGVLGIFQFITKYLNNQVLAGVLAIIIAFPVPTIMAMEGWDDHDRSQRYFSVDSARNLLESCAQNAIIFTGGDNDTFPLWYAQEVEEIRQDVRVCNLSLLNTDWYIDQMRNAYYTSDALPITMERPNYRPGDNDQLIYERKGEKDIPMPLDYYIDLVQKKSYQVKSKTRRNMNNFPSRVLYLDVNVDEALKNIGTVPEDLKPYATKKMQWELTDRNSLDKKDLIILDMIAQINKGNWKRPIYFSSTLQSADYLNLKDHMVKEGLAFRLLPIKHGQPNGIVNTDVMYDNMMNKYWFRNMDKTGIFYSTDYERFIYSTRIHYLELAINLAREGKMNKAKKVIEFSTEKMPDEVISFGDAADQYVRALYATKQEEKARTYIKIFLARSKEMIIWGAKNNGANIKTSTIDDVASRQYLRTLVNVNSIARTLSQFDQEAFKEHEELFNKTRVLLAPYYK